MRKFVTKKHYRHPKMYLKLSLTRWILDLTVPPPRNIKHRDRKRGFLNLCKKVELQLPLVT